MIEYVIIEELIFRLLVGRRGLSGMAIPTNHPQIQAVGKRLALVIGVNNTQSVTLSRLHHAISDAEAMAKVLQKHCEFKLFIPPLLNGEATSARVQKAVLDFTRNRSNDDFLLLYFAGHGQQAYDELHKEIRNTYLGTADFNETEVEEEPALHV